MSKFLSKELMIAAYSKLSLLTKDPDKQGQTQAVSSLKYVAALSRFVAAQKRDLDTRNNRDKEAFIKYVGEVVSLDDGFATKNFYRDFTDAADFNVGSNFYSANVIPLSVKSPNEVYPFPRRGKHPLFKVKNGKLLSESIQSDSINAMFPDSIIRLAFILWLSRSTEIDDCVTAENIISYLKDAMEERYDAAFIEGLSFNGLPDVLEIGIAEDGLFYDGKSAILKKDLACIPELTHRASEEVPEPRNLIFFGAPGTGKSYKLKSMAKRYFPDKNVHRVTFYPDYTYTQFVGCFKPYATQDEETNKTLFTYRFVPGPFLKSYMDAISNPSQSFLLIIEEINRANPAATFGDVFQLLDRNDDGVSEYGVDVPLEMRDFIKSYWLTDCGLSYEEKDEASQARGFSDQRDMLEFMMGELRLPSNMYIWATMNSADQGVFPMDTAFKRRWDFRYMGINEGEDADIDGVPLNEIEVPCGKHQVKWNNLRIAINNFMMSDELKINEDKLLGPFFVNPRTLTEDRFVDVFKDKVLLYLYEDAGKTKRSRMFRKGLKTYSQICDAFEDEGVGIFGSGFDERIAFPDELTGSSEFATPQD